GGLGQMTHRIHHHQRALPAVGLVFAPYPTLLEEPVRQFLLQPRFDFGVAIDALFLGHDDDVLPQTRTTLSLTSWGQDRIDQAMIVGPALAGNANADATVAPLTVAGPGGVPL